MEMSDPMSSEALLWNINREQRTKVLAPTDDETKGSMMQYEIYKGSELIHKGRIESGDGVIIIQEDKNIEDFLVSKFLYANNQYRSRV